MELVSPPPEPAEQNTEETIEELEQQYTTEPEIDSQTPQQATTPATKTISSKKLGSEKVYCSCVNVYLPALQHLLLM